MGANVPGVIDNASALVANRFFISNWQAQTLYSQAVTDIEAIKDAIPPIDYTDALAWCLDIILNGTTGLSQGAQQDIWEYERERDLQGLNEAKDRLASDWAQSNWPLNDGILAAQFERLELEYLNKKLDKSRDIRVEVEKIAVEQVRFAIDQYIKAALAQLGLYEKAAEAQAHIAAQLAAGLLSSAHAQASVSFSGNMQGSGSNQYGEFHNYGTTTNTSYNHNFEE